MGDKSFSIDELAQNISFIRWVKGSTLPEEMEKWDKWLNDSPHNRWLARKAQQKVLGVNFVHPVSPNVIREWEELDKRIKRGEALKRYKIISSPSSRKDKWVIKIAAVLMIVVTSGVTTFFIYTKPRPPDKQDTSEWTTIKTTYQQLKTIALSDGSTIILNANSSITYPSGWMRSQITEVALKGEAYFSISPRKSLDSMPFQVKTPDGTVNVMGTKFVVKAGKKMTGVVLEEGTITITKNRENNDNQVSSYKVIPGERAIFCKSEPEVNISRIPNIEVYTSWTDRRLVLDSSPFSYLVQRIKETYGTKVAVTDDSLYQRKLTGAIKLKDLSYVTQSISEVMNIQVTQKEGTVYFGNVN